MKGPDNPGAVFVPPPVSAGPGVNSFGGDFQNIGDCLYEVDCELVQLGRRVGKEGGDHIVQMSSLSLDCFLETLLIVGKPAEGRDVFGRTLSVPVDG